MFVLTNLEKIKELALKFSQGCVTVLKILASYQEVGDKLNKSKSGAKNNTETILRTSRWRIATCMIFNNKTTK